MTEKQPQPPLTVYVRSRDGALYKNPTILFDEGLITFQHQAYATLVLWLPPTPEEALKLSFAIALDAILGPGGWGGVVSNAIADVEVPLTKPVERRQAWVFLFTCTRRIPRPNLHGGTEKYTSRIAAGASVFEWPSTAFDAKQIYAPKSVFKQGAK